MTNLATEYLGLKLRNPILVGASSLTMNAEKVRACADAGAGAVVLKSLFEEQIGLDAGSLDAALQDQAQWHAEVFQYMEADIGMRYGKLDYLKVLESSRAAVDIPVIASINCVSPGNWNDFAKDVGAAGASALELNIAIMPQDNRESAAEIEERYVRIVAAARDAVSLPLAVKLGPYFTNLPGFLPRLRRAGADGFVLFNRFYRPTIDIDKLQVVADERLSSHTEHSLALRWISLLAGRLQGDLAAATGIHNGSDVVRMLLAGANVVQAVSAFYRHGIEDLAEMLNFLEAWMRDKGFKSVAEFRGRLSQARNPESELFGRCQYIKGLVGLE